MGVIVTCSFRKLENLLGEQFLPSSSSPYSTTQVNGFPVSALLPNNPPPQQPIVYTLLFAGINYSLEIGDWVLRDINTGNPVIIPAKIFSSMFTTGYQYGIPPAQIPGPPGPPGPPGKDAVVPESTMRVMLETQQLERDHYRCTYLDSLNKEYAVIFSRSANLIDDEWSVLISTAGVGEPGAFTHKADSWRAAVDWVNRWISSEVPPV